MPAAKRQDASSAGARVPALVWRRAGVDASTDASLDPSAVASRSCGGRASLPSGANSTRRSSRSAPCATPATARRRHRRPDRARRFPHRATLTSESTTRHVRVGSPVFRHGAGHHARGV